MDISVGFYRCVTTRHGEILFQQDLLLEIETDRS